MSGAAVQFEEVPGYPDVSCLRGTLDLSSATLQENHYPGQQGIAGALAAATYAQMKQGYEWDQGDMDDVIKAANWIYKTSALRLMTMSSRFYVNPLTRRVEPPIELGDLEMNFVLGLTEYWMEIKYANRGFVQQNSDDESHTILAIAFADFFNCCARYAPYGVIENQGDYFAIWKHLDSNSVFVFDPFPSRASPRPALYRIKKGASLLDFFRRNKGWRSKDMYTLSNVVMQDCRFRNPDDQSEDGSSPRRDDDMDDEDMDMDMDMDSAPCSPRSPARVPQPSPRLMRHFQQNANPGASQQWRVNQMDCDDDDD